MCGTCGFIRTMHGGVSSPSFFAFIHRVAFEEVSGHRVLIKSRPENRCRSLRGTSHMGSLEFPPETGLILRFAGKVGNPCRQSRGIDTPLAIRRGEGAQMKWCREPRWSPRVIPVCHGTFEVGSRVPSTVSHFKTERGNSLEML